MLLSRGVRGTGDLQSKIPSSLSFSASLCHCVTYRPFYWRVFIKGLVGLLARSEYSLPKQEATCDLLYRG